jgi:magnesium-transporting ATPase (P-type)
VADEPSGPPQAPWHALPTAELLEKLNSTPAGLDDAEAQRRFETWGANQLAVVRPTSWLIRLLRQFHNVLIYVLLAAAAATAALHYWLDTGVILGVVLINALVGFLQEGRAERAMQRIQEMLSPTAKVVRDGQARVLDARSVVPGDLVLLEAGDRVPADMRLQHGRNLEIDESILTGESLAVDKHPGELMPETDISERSNMAFAGTLVTRGLGRGVLVATGVATELGHISQMLGTVERMSTPLLVKLAVFGRTLSLLIFVLALSVGLFGLLWRGLPPTDMLMVAVSIAVAAIPEGLPPVITIALAIGVQTMARHNAIVRRLPSVETLGEVNVICTDKTGTLTRNEMTVRSIELADTSLTVTGIGYGPDGAVQIEARTIDNAEALGLIGGLVECALNCNDADLYRKNGDWAVAGDPTEGALLALAPKVGLDSAASRQALPRLDLIPFESEQRFMATLHRQADGRRRLFAKGAPEQIVAMCATQNIQGGGSEHLDPQRWIETAERLAGSGQRVLALAMVPDWPAGEALSATTVAGRLEMLGLVGIADPPRAEAGSAIEQCRAAGIEVKMITGDHLGTAASIGSELGLGDPADARAGADLEGLSRAAFDRLASRANVFARANPEHKLELVKSLQRQGQVVAMTGDGVNDAPALTRADIGIAMGLKGTQAAREAASMVLADDNFATIVRAVEQGRVIYDNIRKSIVFLLPTSVAEALVIAVAVLLGYELPMTPVQILWVNMITAVTLGTALAFEAPEPDVMQREPRRLQEPILSGFAVWRTLFVGLLMLLGVTAVFLLESDNTVPYARTVAVNTLVAFEAFYLLSSRRLRTSVLSLAGMRGNPVAPISIVAVLVLQMLFTYEPNLSALFDARAITLSSWMLVVTLGFALLLVVELEKAVRKYLWNH